MELERDASPKMSSPQLFLNSGTRVLEERNLTNSLQHSILSQSNSVLSDYLSNYCFIRVGV